MAGIKRRGRAGYKVRYERYRAQNHYRSNKKLKAVRHAKRVAKQEILTVERDQVIKQLVEKCNDAFKLGDSLGRAKYILKRIVGTLTEKRLGSLLSEDLQETCWFHDRRLTPPLKDMLRVTKFPHSLCGLMTEVRS